MRLLTVAALVSCVAACAVTQTYSLRPDDLPARVGQIDPSERVAAWNRAIEVLMQQGYEPQVLNQDAGYISAKMRNNAPEDALVGTRAIIKITPQGKVSVEVGGVGNYASGSELESYIDSMKSTLLEGTLGQPPGT